MSRTTARRHTAWRWFWSTPVRRGLTIGFTGGLALLFFIPAMGLAIGGTAFAIWGWVATAVVGLCTYVGGRIGALFAPKPRETPPD